MVEIGIVLPTSGPPGAALPDLAAAARQAEASGLDAVWAGDHLMLGETAQLDATLALAAAAAVTSRVAIGTAVFIPALRSLAWAARQTATLCHLAGPGRVRLGVGVGAGPPEESAAAGVERGTRGRRTDEFLHALPGLLSGRASRLPGVDAALTLQPPVPVPQVWVGGTSERALLRAVTYGECWLSSLQTPAELQASSRRLRQLADEAGRSPPRVAVVLHVGLGRGGGRPAVEAMVAAYGLDAARAASLSVGGDTEELADRLGPLLSAGVQHVAVIPEAPSWRSACDALAELRGVLDRA